MELRWVACSARVGYPKVHVRMRMWHVCRKKLVSEALAVLCAVVVRAARWEPFLGVARLRAWVGRDADVGGSDLWL